MNPPTITFIVIVGVLLAFYIMIIRPARQEQEKVSQIIRDLHVGDEIITTAGFFATVRDITTPEEGPVEVLLDFGNGTEIRALTTSVLKRISTAPEPSDQRAEEGT
ncbi:MAG: preprotein translocase subunit YajC [Dehalococcoidia bacterium]